MFITRKEVRAMCENEVKRQIEIQTGAEIREQLERFQKDIGAIRSVSEFHIGMFATLGVEVPSDTRSLGDEITKLAKDISYLMDYLGVEEYTTPSKSGIRKKNKGR